RLRNGDGGGGGGCRCLLPLFAARKRDCQKKKRRNAHHGTDAGCVVQKLGGGRRAQGKLLNTMPPAKGRRPGIRAVPQDCDVPAQGSRAPRAAFFYAGFVAQIFLPVPRRRWNSPSDGPTARMGR